MESENETDLKRDEGAETSPITAEATPLSNTVLPEVLPKASPSHEKCERIGSQIRDMARMGLTKGNVAIAARVSPYILDKYYGEEFAAGEAEMRKGLATVAMAEAMGGNTAILLHLVKTKLGWNETQLIEHSGEVRSVVSAKPLSKEEFIQRFINKDE
jgi:hypothetical protein